MTGFDGGAEDLHDEYLQATLKRVGLPEQAGIVEMQIEYAIKDRHGVVWQCQSRAEAEETREAGDTVVVREHIRTEWRNAS